MLQGFLWTRNVFGEIGSCSSFNSGQGE